MSDDKGLDRRLLGSEIVRPSVAEDVLDESMTSMDTVLIVSQILRLMGELPNSDGLKAELVAAIKKADGLATHPADGAEPIDGLWLGRMGFSSQKPEEWSIAWQKSYGEDTATFVLSVIMHNGIEDATWEISCESIEVPLHSCLMPCEPTTRSQLRDLLAALGVV